jgi:hypothetical protein
MTIAELVPLLSQYRAALEAQIALLEHLGELAARERARAAESPTLLHDVIDERDRVMATLVGLESELMPIRQTLARAREQLSHLAEYTDVVELHRRALELVEDVVRNDEHSRNALREAELTRRTAADALERSETTLAAYRRVVMPTVAAATLVNRKG